MQLIPFLKQHKLHFDYLCVRRKSIPFKLQLIFQKNCALPIIVPLLATMLGSIDVEFILRIFYKNENSFTNRILIEQAELDRLKQRQLRDYLPELQAISRLLYNTRDIMER